MNSIPRVSSLPIQKLISSTYPRSIAIVHGSSPPRALENFIEAPAGYENIVQVNSPAELKNSYGFEKCFVETRGNEILTVAGTKKLLMEEKLRQSLLRLNVPQNLVVENSPSRTPVMIRPLYLELAEEL